MSWTTVSAPQPNQGDELEGCLVEGVTWNRTVGIGSGQDTAMLPEMEGQEGERNEAPVRLG